MVLRRYPDAKVAYERGLTLSPGNIFVLQNTAILGLTQGDVGPARRIAADPRGGTGQDETLAYLARNEELSWALERPHQDRLLQLGPEHFDDERGSWALVRANLYWLRGDRANMRPWGDTAQAAYAAGRHEASDDAQQAVLHGVALAYAGRYEEAIREGKRGLELLPPSKDMYFGPYIQHQLVRIYLLAGRPEPALDLLEPLLEMPYTLTPAWLRIDPMFDPVRKHPQFQALAGSTS